jgi:hypothetical protein
MDWTLNRFADQTMEMGLTVKDTNGSTKTYDFTMYQKGDTKRMLKFTSGEMKGMATLVEDRNSVYVSAGLQEGGRVTAKP